MGKNRTVSEETKNKLSKIRKGKKRKPFSAETREKMRQAKLKNPTNYWKGKKRPPHTEETKAKMREAAFEYAKIVDANEKLVKELKDGTNTISK